MSTTHPKLTFPPLIALEEHFFSTAAANAPSAAAYSEQFKSIHGLTDALTDLGPIRLNSMTENDITMQVISHGPTQPPLRATDAHAANTQLHDAICRDDTTRARFAGFATLSMADPDAASKELAYCVEELGFVGALIDNHANGKTYEGPEYRSFWYTVQSLGVPVYLHPSWATEQMKQGVFPDLKSDGKGTASAEGVDLLSAGATDSLMASSWNWHSDVALHIFKLYAAGVFEKFPRLKIIVGHFGEMIPFMLDRLMWLSPRWRTDPSPTRTFKQIYDENLWITTSGVWSLDPLATMLRNTKRERILFSVDYPFAKNEWGKKWMEELCESGMCDQETVDMIGFKNAEKLLGVRVKRAEEVV